MHQITIPYPDPGLSKNARVHRMKLAKLTKNYRRDCGLIAQNYVRKHGIEPMESADVYPKFYCRDGRRRDRDNHGGMLKAAYDGFVDAGLFVDDAGLFPHPVEFFVDPSDPRVVVEIREREESE